MGTLHKAFRPTDLPLREQLETVVDAGGGGEGLAETSAHRALRRPVRSNGRVFELVVVAKELAIHPLGREQAVDVLPPRAVLLLDEGAHLRVVQGEDGVAGQGMITDRFVNLPSMTFLRNSWVS